MEIEIFFIMMLSGMTTIHSTLSAQYHFIRISLTWTEAQKYCRSNYVDLATIKNTDDMARLIATVNPDFTGKAWIGLYDDLNSWKWSLVDPDFYGPGKTEFRNWNGGEPNNAGGREDCVVMQPTDSLWNDLDCFNRRSFVCYDGSKNAKRSYTLISQLMNWTAAQSYCRRNNTDLVSIRNQTENQAVRNVASTTDIWIGLHRNKLWSNRSNTTFTDWSPGEPNNDGANCVSAWMGDSGRWTDENCATTRPFFCYNVPSPHKSTVKVVGLKMNSSSATSLIAANITKEILQQLREELIRRGLPGDIKLHLRIAPTNSTQP